MAKASAQGGLVQTIFGEAAGDGDGDPERLRSLIPHNPHGPMPFFLCRALRQPDFTESPSGPPVVEIAVASSISDGFQKYARAGKPFIVKGVSAFQFEYEAFKARMQADGTTTYGWDKQLIEVTDIPVSSALADWEAGVLKVNFVDAPVPKLVPNASIIEDLRAVGVTEDQLMLVLSLKGAYTPFHQDPIAGEASGGGWMWLLRGKKVWNFVDNKYSEYMWDESISCIADQKMEDLVGAHNQALWGKVTETYATAGDFIYFPPGCSHRVWTYENSIGIGGYTLFDWDAEPVAEAVKWYEAKGVKPQHGLWPDHGASAEARAAARTGKWS